MDSVPRLLSSLRDLTPSELCLFSDARIVASDGGVVSSHCLLLAAASTMMENAIGDAFDTDVLIICPDLGTSEVEAFVGSILNSVETSSQALEDAFATFCVDLQMNKVADREEECVELHESNAIDEDDPVLDHPARPPTQEKGFRPAAPAAVKRSYPCRDCDAVLSTSYSLKVHESIHEGRRDNECGVCSRRFTQRSHLTVHERTHTGEKGFMCATCGKTFAVPSNLRKHQLSHEREDQDGGGGERTQDEAIENDDPTVTEVQPFLRESDELEEEHIISPHPNTRQQHVCEFCAKTYTKLSDLTLHVKTHTHPERPFSCADCDGEPSFPNRSALKLHQKLVHDKSSSSSSITTYDCTYCARICPSRSALDKHVLVHTGTKPHACPTCGKRFTQISHVNHHVRTVHERVERPKNHFCALCGKAFTNSSMLAKHAKTHTSERPFKCHLCTKGFIQKTHLQTHVLKHNGERPFLCGICGKSYVTKAHLKEHTKQHRGERRYHSCSECGAQYTNLADLRVHERVHTGETPFICSVCNRGFRAKRLLQDHARIHTGDRPFHCHNCNKNFTQSGSLRLHFRRHDTCRLTATEGAYTARKMEDVADLMVDSGSHVFVTNDDVEVDGALVGGFAPPALIGGVAASDLLVSPSAAASILMTPQEAEADVALTFQLPPTQE